MDLRCPAKINTFLSVGPPDRIGYHPLRTIFQAISLSDTLTLEPAKETQITCNWDGLPAENTLTKTLRLLKELIEVPPLHIHLHKEIPAQSGLGGGSSNAAALIRGVIALTRSELPWGQAESIAAAVGADVPFFLVGGRARAEGYGERLTPLPDAPVQHLVVARPDADCSTPEMFRLLDAGERAWRDFPGDDQELFNDFERVAPCASLDLVERLLALGAEGALLTGSGSAVFGRFGSESAAQEVAERLKEEGCAHCWVCRTLTREESLR